MEHMLDTITKKKASTELHRRLGIKSASVSWTTYCPNQMDLLPEYGFTISWKSSWSGRGTEKSMALQMTEDPLQQVHCAYKNHSSELLSRQCVPDFSRGASLTPIDLTVPYCWPSFTV